MSTSAHTVGVIPEDVTLPHLNRIRNALDALPGGYRLPKPVSTAYGSGGSRHTDLDLEALAEFLEGLGRHLRTTSAEHDRERDELYTLQEQRDAVRAFLGLKGV